MNGNRVNELCSSGFETFESSQSPVISEIALSLCNSKILLMIKLVCILSSFSVISYINKIFSLIITSIYLCKFLYEYFQSIVFNIKYILIIMCSYKK